MPTVLSKNGFRFFFYSNENDEPIHVHVSKGDAIGKIWLEPVIQVAAFEGFTKAEERLILQEVKLNYEQFKIKWNEYFSQ